MADRNQYPSEKQDRFIVRLPDGMRDRIKKEAEANNRSMNAEIVVRLEMSFREIDLEGDAETIFQKMFEAMDNVERRVERLEEIKAREKGD